MNQPGQKPAKAVKIRTYTAEQIRDIARKNGYGELRAKWVFQDGKVIRQVLGIDQAENVNE